jgi:hypothetical protein
MLDRRHAVDTIDSLNLDQVCRHVPHPSLRRQDTIEICKPQTMMDVACVLSATVAGLATGLSVQKQVEPLFRVVSRGR